MLPFLAGLGGLAAFGTSRAAYRALKRVRAINWPTSLDATGSPHNFPLGGFEDTMTIAEATRVLGVPHNASKELIMRRHRVVMLANHPDRGGSNYFAAKINEAKDVLTKNSR